MNYALTYFSYYNYYARTTQPPDPVKFPLP